MKLYDYFCVTHKWLQSISGGTLFYCNGYLGLVIQKENLPPLRESQIQDWLDDYQRCQSRGLFINLTHLSSARITLRWVGGDTVIQQSWSIKDLLDCYFYAARAVHRDRHALDHRLDALGAGHRLRWHTLPVNWQLIK